MRLKGFIEIFRITGILSFSIFAIKDQFYAKFDKFMKKPVSEQMKILGAPGDQYRSD